MIYDFKRRDHNSLTDYLKSLVLKLDIQGIEYNV